MQFCLACDRIEVLILCVGFWSAVGLPLGSCYYRCLRQELPLKLYGFIGCGALDVTKPYEFIRFGAMYVTKTYELIGFGAMYVTNPMHL